MKLPASKAARTADTQKDTAGGSTIIAAGMPMRKTTIAAGQLFQRSSVSRRKKLGRDVFLALVISPVMGACIIWLEPEWSCFRMVPLSGLLRLLGRARNPSSGAQPTEVSQTRRRSVRSRVNVSSKYYLIAP